jgi:DNA adenine methylase
MAIKPWIGGKRLLAKTIVAHIPAHSCYVEPFCGGAHVFFRKEPSEVEVLNDINKELITFYRVIQNHYDAFLQSIEQLLISRDEFKRFQNTPPEVLTDIQRAVRFFYIQRSCFGAKVRSPTFGVSKTEKPNYISDSFLKLLEMSYKRLRSVLIECLPYDKLFPRYDAPNTFFYVDPPYYNAENHYGYGLYSKDDFKALAGILGGLKGKFILSINDLPETRAIFKGFKRIEVATKYTIGQSYSTRNTKRAELLIKNF